MSRTSEEVIRSGAFTLRVTAVLWTRTSSGATTRTRSAELEIPLDTLWRLPEGD